VLMALLASTLAILMGMVVSLGHLVQSKMNLQTAVDLAAMSGASWQARYQNALAGVNFRMRQNYKWLLFDVYVTQSRLNGEFKNQVDGSTGYINNPEQVFAICQQSFGYQPVGAINETGRGTNDRTDMCKNALAGGFQIPPIVPSAAPAYNPIYIAINETIRRLGREAELICDESSGQNEAYLRWTTNRTAQINGYQASQFQALLGRFQSAFGGGGVGTPINQGSPVADSTAYSTFIGSLMASNLSGSPELKWITPQRNRASPRFTRSDARLFMNFVNFESTPGGGCGVFIQPLEGATTPTGFSKDMNGGAGSYPENAMNVTLRGEARPNILFWPRGLMPVMVSVGGAKAFGSRIGPPEDYFEEETFGGDAGLVNINFFPNDLTSRNRGIFNKDILNAALSMMPSRYTGQNELRPTNSFMPIVNSPTRYEALYYSGFSVEGGRAGDMFPGSLMPPPTSAGYELTDRNSGDPGMHRRQLFGLDQFYASRAMTLSSWAPLYDGGGNINPGLSGSIGRQGYQIKLMSIAQMCSEMNISGGGTGVGFDALCGGPLRVYH